MGLGTAETERALYDDVWARLDTYGDYAPGERFAQMFRSVASGREDGENWMTSVLDAGCGSGKGAVALKAMGYAVRMCDLTDAGLVTAAQDLPFSAVALWDLDRARHGSTDWVYCTDVMEHLPTEYVMLALDRLLAAADVGLFLSVSLVEDSFGVLAGRPLHLTVRPFTWWRDRLAELGNVIEARDLQSSGVYVVTPGAR